MEQGDSFINNGQHTKPSSGSNHVQPITYSLENKQNSIQDNSNDRRLVPHLARSDIDIPISNITKIMQQVLPLDAKISNDAKMMIQQCAANYVGFIMQKAKESCQSEYRVSLKAEDLLWALKERGFHEYVEPLTISLHHYRNNNVKGDLMTHRKEVIPVSVTQSHNTDGLGPRTEPAVEMLQPTLQQQLASLWLQFSNDSTTNLEMSDSMSIDDFYEDVLSNDTIPKFDPSTN